MKKFMYVLFELCLVSMVIYFVVSGGMLLAGSRDNGSFAQRISSLSMVDGVRKIQFHGDYAYALSGSDIIIVNISNPTSPSVTGTVTSSEADSFNFFRVDGDYMYALDTEETGVSVFNISNPGSPVQTGFCALDVILGVVDMDIVDGYLYVVTDFGRTFFIIDVSVPSTPVIVKTLTNAYSFVGNFKVFGQFAYYVMNGWPAIGVIDVSDPLNPVSAGEFYYGDRPIASIFVSGNYLYMGHSSYLGGYYSNNLLVFNLDQWPQVTSLGSLHVSDDEYGAQGLFKAGNCILGAYGPAGVRITDVSNPLSLSEAGIINTDGDAYCVKVYRDMVLIGTDSGLEIWQYPPLVDFTRPFGTFETPLAGAEVSGGIPVSGWVLDDQGIDRVEIFRDPVSGETSGLKKIGDAVLVKGARPDVEADYPDYPGNNKAGWGYMMLTNQLPNSNGIFTIHAIANDVDGHQVSLGTKTITVNNEDAEVPFGAIDTPIPGGIASGKNYLNFGWALTPLPNAIPEDGSTIIVWVDGQPLGHPVYNRYREDIALLFPGLLNSDGAVGYYYLNTTRYTNGVHTIAWSVEDNAGNREGIGSRYFTIRNSGGSADNRGQQVGKSGRGNCNLLSRLGIIKKQSVPVLIKKGYKQSSSPVGCIRDKNGRTVIDFKVGERVEIHLDTENGDEWHVVMGHNHSRALPIGSTLDRKKGIFFWQPGPGFRGDFPLVFCKGDSIKGDGEQLKIVKILCKIR